MFQSSTIVALTLSLSLSLSFAACGGGEEPRLDAPPASAQAPATVSLETMTEDAGSTRTESPPAAPVAVTEAARVPSSLIPKAPAEVAADPVPVIADLDEALAEEVALDEPAAPAAVEDDTPDFAHPTLEVVDYGLGTGVENRQLTGQADSFDLSVGKVWAWIKVNNSGDPSQVTMVWKRDGEESWRIDLNVGTSPAWRTWSRKTIRKWDAGIWTVDILAPDGTMIESIEFEVKPTTGTPADVAGG